MFDVSVSVVGVCAREKDRESECESLWQRRVSAGFEFLFKMCFENTFLHILLTSVVTNMYKSNLPILYNLYKVTTYTHKLK